MVTCVYPPIVYPPDCLVPPCQPPPPPGGNQCQRSYFVCNPADNTWTLSAQDCVPNSSCTGSIICGAPDSAYVETLNGCLTGVPLSTPDPTAFTPPCNAACAPVNNCCLKMRWYCQCAGNISTWVPVPGYPSCVSNGDCGDGENESGNGANYEHTQQNACPCGTGSPPLPGGWSPPAIAASCCDKNCTTTALATVVGSAWQVVQPVSACEFGCVNDGGWVVDPNFGNSVCHLRWIQCGAICTNIADCPAVAKPADPAGPPAACLVGDPNKCQTVWTTLCLDTGWSTPGSLTGGNCVASCTPSDDWVVDIGTLSATKTTCDASNCAAGDLCVPTNVPTTAGSPALLGNACPTGRHCHYTYVSTCSGGAWSDPTVQSEDGCVTGCADDSDWQGTGCIQTRGVCGQQC